MTMFFVLKKGGSFARFQGAVFTAPPHYQTEVWTPFLEEAAIFTRDAAKTAKDYLGGECIEVDLQIKEIGPMKPLTLDELKKTRSS